MQQDPYKYNTISAPATAEFKDRGSRFLAFAYPVDSVKEVKERVAALKKEHPKAVHHCVGYRMGPRGDEYRAHDDGEPAGSAGRPILNQIISAGLTNTLVVVVRYFGGTLLGVPGLINAYKTVTTDALSAAPVTEKWIERKLLLSFDYPVMGEVMYLLRQCGATIYQQDLQLFCMVKAGIPEPQADAYLAKLSELRSLKAEVWNGD